MENNKFKIIIKHWDEKITIERLNSDLTMDELYRIFKALALAMGYSSNTVHEYFGE